MSKLDVYVYNPGASMPVRAGRGTVLDLGGAPYAAQTATIKKAPNPGVDLTVEGGVWVDADTIERKWVRRYVPPQSTGVGNVGQAYVGVDLEAEGGTWEYVDTVERKWERRAV